ncbi:MAG TPA: ABC transporter ATP-binding protein [Vicinamibacterales bacterium]|jgi:ABC-2 type transport system ATP-binding protein
MRSERAPVAELLQVSKKFAAVTALDGVDLALAPGQLTALLGPNGAGKTTAVRLMLGTSRPTAGAVRLFGLDPSDRAARSRVGAMLQIGRVPETLTPREHLRLFSSYYGDPRPMADLLAVAGIADVADRRFGDLSGGQKQRVLFAASLCGDPQLLFLDEPTVGLDVEARHLFWDAIRQIIAAGRSILLTTHYLEEADALADRVVVLQRGRIVADGSPSDIKQQVAGRLVRCITNVGEAEIRQWPSVHSVRADGSALVILTSDAEGLARHLLARDAGLTDLQITGIGLEEAFVALTGRSES